MSFTFEEKKLFIQNTIKFYKNRGYTLRGSINSILKSNGFINTKSSWEDTEKQVTDFPESVISNDIFDKVIQGFQKDLLKTILFRDKFISIYEEPKNFDLIFSKLDEISSLFDEDYYPVFENSTAFEFIKTEHQNLVFFTFKSIRSLSTKVDLGVYALKQDYHNEEYDKVYAYKTVDLACFNSIIFDLNNKNIILSSDLANQFQDEHLRAEIARLVNLIRQTTGLGHTIEDTGINLFPCIEKFYKEEEGVIKELAFKTDDGVAHREIARSGIDDVREGEYHVGGTASTNIEPYDIKKIYGGNKLNEKKDLLLKGSWYILNTTEPKLTNVTITVNSEKDLYDMINKIIAFSK
ncbi:MULTISPECIES: hypothetical protein [unclassified Acinetobacter]|uniref:hypothetical protein n=1 Tax=unclassified Acinetobacter TaxID=196816 RepID=UPI0015D1ECC4|nr:MULTISPECIES: hypothetical protein [unclassified Acinetobacter]